MPVSSCCEASESSAAGVASAATVSRVVAAASTLAAAALYIRRLFMTDMDDARLKKLRFRAWRRGFREADLILGPFADKHVSGFSPAELDWFEAMLEVPDHDLYG